MTDHRKQNEIASSYFEASDLAEREPQIVQEVSEATQFVPATLLGRSTFWGSDKIGAFHYSGEYKSQPAVLKVQGIKPATSEIFMLESFEANNHSQAIRPPRLYASIPWDDDKRYEALIMEDVQGEKVVSSPTNEKEVAQFFELYQDYQENCLQTPWLDKPTKPITEVMEQNFAKWQRASEEVYPNHPLRNPQDAGIISRVRAVLASGYKNVDSEFQHGHFSAVDLYKVKNQVVLLSNLYWSWRAPLYDAIFAYHWYIYRLANTVDNLSPADIDQHRELWLSKIEAIPQAQGERRPLLDLALLERATAGLLMDALTVEPQRPIAEYVVESTRQRVLELLEKLS